MFNILLIAKDKVGVDAISWGSSSSQRQLLCQNWQFMGLESS